MGNNFSIKSQTTVWLSVIHVVNVKNDYSLSILKIIVYYLTDQIKQFDFKKLPFIPLEIICTTVLHLIVCMFFVFHFAMIHWLCGHISSEYVFEWAVHAYICIYCAYYNLLSEWPDIQTMDTPWNTWHYPVVSLVNFLCCQYSCIYLSVVLIVCCFCSWLSITAVLCLCQLSVFCTRILYTYFCFHFTNCRAIHCFLVMS